MPDAVWQIVMVSTGGHDPMDTLTKKVEDAIEKREIRPLVPEHFVWNIVSMCAYPFIMQPIIQSYKDKSEMEMNAFFV